MPVENRVFRSTLHLTLVFSLSTIWFRFSVGTGFLLGGLMSSLAFRLLILDNKRMLKGFSMGIIAKEDVSRYHWRSYLKRCSLYAGALAISLFNAHTSFLATLGGLLLPRLAIYFHNFRGRIKRGD